MNTTERQELAEDIDRLSGKLDGIARALAALAVRLDHGRKNPYHPTLPASDASGRAEEQER